MKKSIRIIAIAMVAVMLCLALASCGKTLSGKYENDTLNVTYEFKGSKVTVSYEGHLTGKITSVEGKYAIDDDKITFTFDDEDDADNYAGEFAFEETDDGIKIGKIEYKKK